MLRAYIARRIRDVAKILAEEISREMATTTLDRQDEVKLDVVDAITQLGKNPAKLALNQFYSMNHRWIAMLDERNRRTARTTYDFIESEMDDAMFLLDQFKIVQSRRDAIVEVDGQVLDLGVYKGGLTTRFTASTPLRDCPTIGRM